MFAILPQPNIKTDMEGSYMDVEGMDQPISPVNKNISSLMMQGLIKQAAKKRGEKEWQDVPKYKQYM